MFKAPDLDKNMEGEKALYRNCVPRRTETVCPDEGK